MDVWTVQPFGDFMRRSMALATDFGTIVCASDDRHVSVLDLATGDALVPRKRAGGDVGWYFFATPTPACTLFANRSGCVVALDNASGDTLYLSSNASPGFERELWPGVQPTGCIYTVATNPSGTEPRFFASGTDGAIRAYGATPSARTKAARA